jgi:hypothetical protein
MSCKSPEKLAADDYTFSFCIIDSPSPELGRFSLTGMCVNKYKNEAARWVSHPAASSTGQIRVGTTGEKAHKLGSWRSEKPPRISP